MRFVVVDASVAVKWYVDETGSDLALSLLDRDDLLLLAPDIFLAEIVNALLRQSRAGQLTAEAFDTALGDLSLTAPQLIASARLLERAVAIARRLAHPVYDCLYLALAERWETVFVTADVEFVTRCRRQLADDPITNRLRLLHEHEP